MLKAEFIFGIRCPQMEMKKGVEEMPKKQKWDFQMFANLFKMVTDVC